MPENDGQARGPRRCLFCRQDASGSRSVEHVLPESLGNTTQVLPPGIVCDACNNYFARKVEAPVLGSDPILALRHIEAVPSKRGHVPDLGVYTSLGAPGMLTRQPGEPSAWVLTLPEAEVDRHRTHRRFALLGPNRDRVVHDASLGRFVCKVALEAVAARCYRDPVAYESLLETDDLELCRLHARYGQGPTWPVRVHRIHPPERMWPEGDGLVQRVWEHDLLVTPGGQLVFAMAIFGLELAINVLEPESTAYEDWLTHSRSPSLLYPHGLPADDSPTATG